MGKLDNGVQFQDVNPVVCSANKPVVITTTFKPANAETTNNPGAAAPMKFKCPLCFYRLADEGRYQYHMFNHPPLAAHGCEFCDKVFQQFDEKRMHCKTHFLGGEPFVCKCCKEQFTKMLEWESHVRRCYPILSEYIFVAYSNC
jgi:hypothetical protein